MPITITSATTASLMATTTWLTRLESLTPPMSTPATSSAMSIAGRSTTPSAAEPIDAGISNGVSSSTFWR